MVAQWCWNIGLRQLPSFSASQICRSGDCQYKLQSIYRLAGVTRNGSSGFTMLIGSGTFHDLGSQAGTGPGLGGRTSAAGTGFFGSLFISVYYSGISHSNTGSRTRLLWFAEQEASSCSRVKERVLEISIVQSKLN